jgi:tRNA (mo5U34)-methyltransferase
MPNELGGSTDAITASLPPDDPRLEGWYHTIELAPGVVSRGYYDHRPILDRYGIPASLAGMSALDVGTADGFFAFELERRGADRVVATDVADPAEWDWMPRVSSRRWPDEVGPQHLERFDLARAALGSRVERVLRSVYELSPQTVGSFDLVFCGSLLLHLRDPLGALCAIRSVTKKMAIIETAVDPDLADAHSDQPFVRFGAREHEEEPGEKVTYWWVTPRALEDMLLYAGFDSVERRGTFHLHPTQMASTAVMARVARSSGLSGTLRRFAERRRNRR